jgi:hypothetical protein
MYKAQARCLVSNYITVDGHEVGDLLALTSETIDVIEPEQPASFRCSNGANAINRISPITASVQSDRSGLLDSRTPQDLSG